MNCYANLSVIIFNFGANIIVALILSYKNVWMISLFWTIKYIIMKSFGLNGVLTQKVLYKFIEILSGVSKLELWN